MTELDDREIRVLYTVCVHDNRVHRKGEVVAHAQNTRVKQL